MNFFKRSKASDKAEDVAVAASVQLILDEINEMYPGFKRLTTVELKYLKKDFELLVSQRSEETLKLKRIILRILAARSELAHMSSESSQAEAGVKIKAKDAKEEAERLKAEVEKAKKSLGKLEHDKGVAKKLELDIIKKLVALVQKSSKAVQATIKQIAGEPIEKLVERSSEELEAFNVHMKDYVNSTKKLVDDFKLENKKLEKQTQDVRARLTNEKEQQRSMEEMQKMFESNKLILEKKKEELNALILRAKSREARYKQKEIERREQYERRKKEEADIAKRQAETMRQEAAEQKAIKAAEARARIEASKKEAAERKLRQKKEKEKAQKALKLKKQKALEAKRKLFEEKRKSEEIRLAKLREMKKIKQEEMKAAEVAKKVNDKFQQFRKQKEAERKKNELLKEQQRLQREMEEKERQRLLEQEKKEEEEERERQAKLKKAKHDLLQRQKVLEKEKHRLQEEKKIALEKKLKEEKRAANEEKKRQQRITKLKMKLKPCLSTCEKLVAEEHEPPLHDIDKCINHLRDVVHDCHKNDFSDAQVLMGQAYLDEDKDPLGLFVLRKKRIKMDETVEKLVNRKLLDDARNEEISRTEAEHNSPWNLRSIVGFFNGAFIPETENTEGTTRSSKRYG